MMRLPFVSRAVYEAAKEALDAERRAHETSRVDLKAHIALLSRIASVGNSTHIPSVRTTDSGNGVGRGVDTPAMSTGLPWILEQACDDVANGSRELRRKMLRDAMGMWTDAGQPRDRGTLVRLRECVRLGEEYVPQEAIMGEGSG